MNEYIEKIHNVVKGKVIVFIDTANLEQSVKDMSVRLDDIPDFDIANFRSIFMKVVIKAKGPEPLGSGPRN